MFATTESSPLRAIRAGEGRWALSYLTETASHCLILCERGTLRVEEDGAAWVLPERHLLLIRPCRGSITVPPGGSAAVLSLARAITAPHRADLDRAVGIMVAADGDGTLVAHLVAALLTEPGLDSGNMAVFAHLTGMIAMMCRDIAPFDIDIPSMRRALETMEQRLGDHDLNPEAIARSANVSTRTLHRMFELRGTTVGAWLRSQRLAHCCADLQHRPDLSVQQIGARWGFWDAPHFNRTFKQTFGVPPGEYRRRSAARTVREQTAI